MGPRKRSVVQGAESLGSGPSLASDGFVQTTSLFSAEFHFAKWE